MAKTNGTLTDSKVSTWFDGLDFDRQASVLSALSTSHTKQRSARIAELRRELAALDGGDSGDGSANGVRKYTRRKPLPAVKAKYRDPKSGQTWSGRGRMASWLAAKVKAGEKASRYLIK